jgi:hypothetical protein
MLGEIGARLLDNVARAGSRRRHIRTGAQRGHGGGGEQLTDMKYQTISHC